VQACVRAARPDTPDDLGSYGVSSRRFAFMGYGGSADYVTALNDVVVAIMVEKKGTVEGLEEVLSVAGVDMIQWGGVDYAMSVGKAGQRGSPEIKAVEKRVVQTALRMGVPPRAEILTADDAKYYLDLGVRHFCVGTDLSVLHQWWREQGDAVRKTLSDA
jgi:4-hydroxy-2-oxoheptanedioate aldolase